MYIESTVTNPHAVVRLQARSLFGHLDYDIPETTSDQSLERLAILYGSNGSGKTTLLRILYHMLSPRDNAGHRTYLARLSFRLLLVKLADGTIVKADRDEAQPGSFHFSVQRPDGRSAKCHISLEANGALSTPIDDALQLLSEVASSIYFLSDNRSMTVEHNQHGVNQPGWLQLLESGASLGSSGREMLARGRRTPDERDSIDYVPILLDAVSYFTQTQATLRARTGDETASSVYSNLIRGLSNPTVSDHGAIEKITALSRRLDNIASKARLFEQYGLVSHANAGELAELVRTTPTNVHATVAGVLEPYVNGLDARLAALEGLYGIIDSMVGTLSRYMKQKRVTFQLGKGLSIETPQGKALRPDQLSSGERHLLMIVSSAVLATSSPSILIIDEPEISLNTEWHRTLVNSLLELTRGSAVQVLLASHSLQMAGAFRPHVADLDASTSRGE